VVGGLTIGVLTDVLPYFDDNLGDFASKMPLAPAFILILIVLLIRPQGLFGTKRVERV
jgi:branched-chain amino acid transport system permease protein